MQITSIAVSDVFVHENGSRVCVTKIFCGFDEQEKRWETSVGYNVVPSNPSYSTLSNVTKARDFVLMIQECGPVGHNFVTQLHEKAEQVVVPVEEEISFTPGAGVTSSGNSSVAVGNGVAAPAIARPGPSQIEQDFIQNAVRYGLQPSDLGRKIRVGKSTRRKYTIIGAKPRNWKFPILIRGPRGGTYKLAAEKAVQGLK